MKRDIILLKFNIFLEVANINGRCFFFWLKNRKVLRTSWRAGSGMKRGQEIFTEESFLQRQKEENQTLTRWLDEKGRVSKASVKGEGVWGGPVC